MLNLEQGVGDPLGLIAKGYSYRCWCEYLANWHLLERNEDDIRSIALSAGIGEDEISTSLDANGLTMYVTIRK